jgi:transglutaminase-like putative cysteine protease
MFNIAYILLMLVSFWLRLHSLQAPQIDSEFAPKRSRAQTAFLSSGDSSKDSSRDSLRNSPDSKLPTQTLAQATEAKAPSQPEGSEAQQDKHFRTTLNSTYTVSEQGQTVVNHEFIIKNLTPQYLITKYGLTIGSNQIQNIQASSDGQQLQPTVTNNQGSTQIDLEFSDKVVGKDKIREFNISYVNPDAAQVNGSVLEVNIPQMANASHYDQHQVQLVTPAKFGEPTRINPDNYQAQATDETQIITYTNLDQQGVSAIFGSRQVFNLTIRYYLNNPNNQLGITQVSLPPDTAYQKINYQALEPKPEAIKADADGNWIATYHIPGNSTTEVNVQASVLTSLAELNPDLHPDPLPAHTSGHKFWPIEDEQIVNVAQKLAQQQPVPEAIYDFTIEKLDYTTQELNESLERLGAVGALQYPQQATCQEFTDLFIALARANQIPARRITGYAYSQNPQLRPLSLVTDVLHTWPEYYNQTQQKWVPVDPTWGDTTQGVDYFHQFDLNHLVFAINGKSSHLPYPAGAYKLENKQTKDIQVEFGQEFKAAMPKFELEAQPVKLGSILPLPGSYRLKIVNQTGQAWRQSQLSVQATGDNGTSLQLDLAKDKFSLLPYQRQEIGLNLYNKDSRWSRPSQIKVTILTPGNGSVGTQESQQTYQLSLKSSGLIGSLLKASGLRSNRFINIDEISTNFQSWLQQPRAYFYLGGGAALVALIAGGILVLQSRR